jgi:uncharacterized membrane protein
MSVITLEAAEDARKDADDMIVEHYTRRWQTAGLIDGATADRILAWESIHRRPVWLWAVAGMGALAIALGIMAVVGANWEDIPAWFKLTVELALTTSCAAGVLVFWTRGQVWPREIAALLLFGLVLAGIALIGQVYQLQSAAWRALVLWIVLCTPFLALLSTTRLVGAIWVAAAVTAWFAAYEPMSELFAALGITPKSGAYFLSSSAVVKLMTYLAATLLIAIGALRRLWLPATTQGNLLLQLGFAGLVTCVSMAVVLGGNREGGELGALALGAVMTGLTAAALLIDGNARRRREALIWLGLGFVVWAISLFPLGGDRLAGNVARAILYIAYWAAIGWLTARAGWRGLFALAFTMIALRLLVLYFEAIGGLTATGLGLIGGGMLCIALATLGWRLTRGVTRQPLRAVT